MVPSGCLLSGLEVTSSSHLRELALTEDMVIQGQRVQLGELKLCVYTIVGSLDDLEV